MPAKHVAKSQTFTGTTPSDREITLTRLFDAPRALVFDAMTKPEHVRRWWGNLDDRHSMTGCEIDLRPGGARGGAGWGHPEARHSMTVGEIDLRPGGAWRWVGRTPGGEYAFSGVYHEIL